MCRKIMNEVQICWYELLKNKMNEYQSTKIPNSRVTTRLDITITSIYLAQMSLIGTVVMTRR